MNLRRGRFIGALPFPRPFSNCASYANHFLLLLPCRGHGSLRGRRMLLQHLVRSTGAAMSTTGSHGIHAAQRPPSQSACTLAPVGDSHPHYSPARLDLIKVCSGVHWLL